MERKKLYPAPGRKVRDPQTKRELSRDGEEKDIHEPYWHRRLADGDVVTKKPDYPAEPAPSGDEKKSKTK
jgi:hypothetical protein